MWIIFVSIVDYFIWYLINKLFQTFMFLITNVLRLLCLCKQHIKSFASEIMLIIYFQMYFKAIKSETLLQHFQSDTLSIFQVNEYLWICQTMFLLISNFKTIGYILYWKMCLYGIVMVLFKYNGSLLQKYFHIMYAIFTCQLHSYHIQNYFSKRPCCTHFYDFSNVYCSRNDVL